MAPPGVELFVMAIGYKTSSNEEYAKNSAYIADCIPYMLEHQVQVIQHSGVPYITMPGFGEEERLHAEVAQLTELPYFIDVETSAMAMHAVGCHRVVVVSPIFSDERNESVKAYLPHYGIDVVAAERVRDHLDDKHLPPPLMPLDAIFEVTKAAFERHRDEADGVWIAGAAMASVAILDRLEDALGVPVVSSTQALNWAAFRTLGITEPIKDCGSLMLTDTQPKASW
jgi:maleate cis-trans isomerase